MLRNALCAPTYAARKALHELTRVTMLALRTHSRATVKAVAEAAASSGGYGNSGLGGESAASPPVPMSVVPSAEHTALLLDLLARANCLTINLLCWSWLFRNPFKWAHGQVQALSHCNGASQIDIDGCDGLVDDLEAWARADHANSLVGSVQRLGAGAGVGAGASTATVVGAGNGTGLGTGAGLGAGAASGAAAASDEAMLPAAPAALSPLLPLTLPLPCFEGDGGLLAPPPNGVRSNYFAYDLDYADFMTPFSNTSTVAGAMSREQCFAEMGMLSFLATDALLDVADAVCLVAIPAPAPAASVAVVSSSSSSSDSPSSAATTTAGRS